MKLSSQRTRVIYFRRMLQSSHSFGEVSDWRMPVCVWLQSPVFADFTDSVEDVEALLLDEECFSWDHNYYLSFFTLLGHFGQAFAFPKK